MDPGFSCSARESSRHYFGDKAVLKIRGQTAQTAFPLPLTKVKIDKTQKYGVIQKSNGLLIFFPCSISISAHYFLRLKPSQLYNPATSRLSSSRIGRMAV